MGSALSASGAANSRPIIHADVMDQSGGQSTAITVQPSLVQSRTSTTSVLRNTLLLGSTALLMGAAAPTGEGFFYALWAETDLNRF